MKTAERKARYDAQDRPPERVTVRLKPELARQLDAERRATGLTVTEVIEQALTGHFARQPRRGRLTLIQALQKHGVIGAVDLGPDASVDYKSGVRQAIDTKHGHR
ncbi:ribbon-helix-helix domain-containing protein [Sinimarinibacterium thermocellulolyticum]|uniref:Ribbon-helix-helix domain-containing protein n=1 Tax=Sinimarinibacterium thermocellulolyticum TaxID=3170016 RepID=A0ABV2A7M4_9GAMM